MVAIEDITTANSSRAGGLVSATQPYSATRPTSSLACASCHRGIATATNDEHDSARRSCCHSREDQRAASAFTRRPSESMSTLENTQRRAHRRSDHTHTPSTFTDAARDLSASSHSLSKLAYSAMPVQRCTGMPTASTRC